MIIDSTYERTLEGNTEHSLVIQFDGVAGELYRLEAKVAFEVTKDAVGEIIYEFNVLDPDSLLSTFTSVGSEHIFDTQLISANRTFEFSQRFNAIEPSLAEFKIKLEGNVSGPINVDLYLYEDGKGIAAPEIEKPEPPVDEMTISDSWISGDKRLNFEMDENITHPSTDGIAADGFKVEGYTCDRVKVSNSNNNVLWVYVTGQMDNGPHIVTYTKADCSEPIQSVTGSDFPEGEHHVA